MKFLVVLTATLACALAKPSILAGDISSLAATSIGAPLTAASIATPLSAVSIGAPLATQSKYHIQDAIGQASYGHAEPLQTHNAIQDAAGNKIGSFSYVSPGGQVLRTDYVADALGYRVASNALPVGPSLPIADTPEVAIAKAAHLATKTVILNRRRRSIAAPLVIGQTPAATAPLGSAIAAPLAIGYTSAVSAPLAASIASPLSATIAAPLAAPIASPLAASIAAPLVAPWALGHTPAATAPLGAPIATPLATTIW
ncbi:adult-specific rigid cuticular protein 15.5-like [Zootermopsis nevadensis]|uniref:Cuticle protein 7 n=1 Tax=Zootermopsis nevadensis TaxID=136037 RepID=A0A067R7C5_ZOONE|nr:adult-specific rigid cuticular protein 15.5-like [Zootermopsis nevadensis]KDR19384.1 Cuticle protein 7 [Zootermopsis nevadensis]